MIELEVASPLLARFATELERTSPRDLPAPPDLAAYAAEDREAARYAWASRIADEYRSVAVFSELLGLLADLEAPYAALCAVQRLIGDELRHTHLVTRVVDWLGGRDDLAIDLAGVSLPPRGTESAARRAMRIVGRELVVAEEESVVVLAAYRDASTEPAIRAALALLLVDEVRHAATGRALFALLADFAPTAAEHAAVQREMIADRAAVRAAYRAAATGGAGRALGASIELRDLTSTRATRRCSSRTRRPREPRPGSGRDLRDRAEPDR